MVTTALENAMKTGNAITFRVGKSPIIEDNVRIISIESDDVYSKTFVYERASGDRFTAFENHIELINL